jgi:hypothetical protein
MYKNVSSQPVLSTIAPAHLKLKIAREALGESSSTMI